MTKTKILRFGKKAEDILEIKKNFITENQKLFYSTEQLIILSHFSGVEYKVSILQNIYHRHAHRFFHL